MWCSIKSRLSNIWIGNRRSIFEGFNHRRGETNSDVSGRLVIYLQMCPRELLLKKHPVNTSTDVLIQMKPYPILFALQGQVKCELQQMINLGIIEETDIPYSALIVLIKKNDRSLRMCRLQGIKHRNCVWPQTNARINSIWLRSANLRSETNSTFCYV